MHKNITRVGGLVLGLLLSLSVTAGDYIDEARQYYADGEYRAAVIQLKNALQENPDNLQARLLLAGIQLETGDAAAAEKEFRQARRLGAKREDWITGLAQALLRQREFEQLLQQIEPADDDAPALQADILVLRGQAMMAKGQSKEAEARFRRALDRDDKHLDAHLGLAQLALNAGDQETAGRHVDTALEIDSRSFSARFIKAQILATGNEEQAADWYDRALEIRPGAISARLGKARFLITQGDFDAARSVVEQLQQLLPESSEVLHLTGLIEFNAGNYTPALEAFNQVLAARPKFAPAMLFLGTIHYQQGDLDQARLYLHDYLDYVPGHMPARQMLGGIYLRQGQAKEAIEVLLPAAEAAGDNAGYLALLGVAYMQVDEVEQAIRYLERARELAPDALPLQAQLAMGRILQGESEAGLEELQSLTDSQGGMEYDRLLVMSYLALKDYEGALRAAAAMRDKYSESAETVNLLGVVQLAMERREAARDTFNEAIALDGDFPAAYVNLANLEFKVGDAEAAAEVLGRAASRGLESPEILLARARLAEATGDAGRTGQLYRQAYERYADNIQVSLEYADFLVRRGDQDKALTLLSSLNREQSDQPGVLARLGQVQISSGDLANAEANIRSLLEQTPDSGYAHFLLGRLQLARDQVDKAIPALERAVELGMDSIEPLILLTEAYAATGQDEKALARIEQTKKKYPDIGLGFELEGDFHMRREASAKALQAYERAYAGSANRTLMIKLYRVHKALEQPEQARRVLRRWLEAHPDDSEARLILASELSREDDSGAALAEYKTVIEAQPDNLPALNNAAILAAEAEPGLGLEYARRAYELSPSRPEIIDTYGWLLLMNGRSEQAERLLKEAAVRAPHIPDIRYHLAVAYHRNGKDHDALLELDAIKRDLSDLSDSESAESLYRELKQSRE